MKTIFAMSLLALSLTSFAATEGHYFQPEFEITSVKPICPKPAPGQVTCMAFGYNVTISVTIGCLDKMVFHEVKTVPTRRGIEIHSLAVAYADPKSLAAMCYRANTIIKTISIPSIEGGEPVLINDIIETH